MNKERLDHSIQRHSRLNIRSANIRSGGYGGDDDDIDDGDDDGRKRAEKAGQKERPVGVDRRHGCDGVDGGGDVVILHPQGGEGGPAAKRKPELPDSARAQIDSGSAAGGAGGNNCGGGGRGLTISNQTNGAPAKHAKLGGKNSREW